MYNKWKDVVVTKAVTAVYVKPGEGKSVHNNRPFHGFVLNDKCSVKDYCFSDGNVMRTDEYELFYLPKGSTYEVKSLVKSGCYAINFDAEITEVPFTIPVRNYDTILKIFKEAEKAWRQQSEFRQSIVIKCVYEIILQMKKEMQKIYEPSSKDIIIAPALKMIKEGFTDNNIAVSKLADACGVSEAYLRRIFINKFGVSPKEYIIQMRINYASQLLESEQFSVSEVAQMCGYAENCHFSREYTKRMGVNPSQVLRQI